MIRARLSLALVLLGACAEERVVLPPEPATIVLSPPPVTSGPPAIRATLPPIDAQAAASESGLEVAARDPRRGGVRSSALLTNELSILESLRRATSPSSPDLPALLRRLAEDYVELRKAGAPSASQDAIARYEELSKSYPSGPRADEVLYYLALEAEVSGDVTKARKVYFALISNQPASSFVPFAYFAFGELFLREAKSDPSKYALAQAAYAQALKGATPTLVPDVLWRSGQVEEALGDAARAAWFHDRLKREYPASAAASRIGERP